MDLEELKLIWDSQNKEPLFVLTETDLHAVVQRRNQQFNRGMAFRYHTEISICVIAGILMLAMASCFAFGRAEWLATLRWPKVAPSPWDIAALFVAGGLWFYFALYLNIARLRHQRCGETFDSSLRGDLDRAIARVDLRLKIAEGIVWWGFIPAYAAATLWIVVMFRLSAGPGKSDLLSVSYVLAGAVMVAAFVAELWCLQKAIRERYQPHRRELESLRQKLLFDGR